MPHAVRRALAYRDRWIPHASRPQYSDVTEFLPRFWQVAAEARRDIEAVPVTVWALLKIGTGYGAAAISALVTQRGEPTIGRGGRNPFDPRPLGQG